MLQEKIIHRLQRTGIDELQSIESLNELDGDYINLTCTWPNGAVGKILDDTKKYYGTQVCQRGSGKCYGIAADETQIAVFLYGDGGKDAQLVMWLAL